MQDHTNDGLRGHQPEAGSLRQASRAGWRGWCEQCVGLAATATAVVVVVILTAVQAATPERCHV